MKDEKEDENNNVPKKILIIISDIYNNNKKFSISKENYEFILNYINNTEDTNLIPFINYLNDVEFPILNILIDGYIHIDFEDENKNKLILDNISKLIKIYFNRDIFKSVYNRLSKFFRKHLLLKDINNIKKFEKTFDVWKLLYNINNNSIKYKINDNIESNNFEIEINNKQLPGENSYIIEINFSSSPILHKIKIKENFFFLNLYDDQGLKLTLTYLNLFNLNTAELFKNNNKMIFTLSKNNLTITLNKEKILTNQFSGTNFKFEQIKKFKIMNYLFFADIYEINVQIKNLNQNENSKDANMISKTLNINIKKEKFSEKFTYDLFLKNENNNDNSDIKSESENYIKFKRIKFGNSKWSSRKKRLSSIKYYGGIECFIPLFKIIKYIIEYLGNYKKDNQNQKEIDDYLNKSIIWIKDIIKIILRLISLSEKNYLNFQNVIIPLIGAFAEISHTLNKLVSSGIISMDVKKSLYNDEVIYSLFIALMTFRPSKNSIEIYNQIFELEKKWNIIFSLDYLFLDVENIDNSKFYWYFLFLYNFILFIVIYTDSLDSCPKKIIDELEQAIFNKIVKKQNQIIGNLLLSITQFLNLLKSFYSYKKSGINKLQYSIDFLNTNNFYFKFLINVMKTVLNVRFLSKINGIGYNFENSFIILMIELLSENKLVFQKNDNVLKEINDTFLNYYDDSGQIEDWFGVKTKFRQPIASLIKELIDYHGEYHKLMKELFLFNRFWSKEKIFFNLSKGKTSKTKYKNINYYTRNFQRPIIYPVIDYKYRYPEFSKYKMKENLYMNDDEEKEKEKNANYEKIENDFNFDLDCPEFDEIIKNINTEIYKQIKNVNKKFIDIFNVCQVKQYTHIKGNLFLYHLKSKLRIIFFSYFYDFENNEEKYLQCNKINNNKDIMNNDKIEETVKNFCYGQLFKCPKKDKYRKIEIDFKDIRMILSKIYFYRKTGIEIFTETKSYFFNFFSTEEFDKFITNIEPYFQNSEKITNEKEPIYFFPITIDNNKKIGYLKTAKKTQKTDFIEFISNCCDNNEISAFDIIILMNLVANRSYLDLNQYPVFPVMFFYDGVKPQSIERNFKSHIGFQTHISQAKKRFQIVNKNFNDNNKIEDEDEEEEEEENHNLCYFNTHFSNIVYSTNFMVRLFPYSFCAIEIQGKYFDDPNRLFFSIEKTLLNISSQISDLRELIPELFYLPEMLINVNKLNLLSLKDGTLVDNVRIPDDVPLDKYANEDSMINILNEEKIHSNINDVSKRKNLFKIFLFILKMKNTLENMKENLAYWLNIIFGPKQKYLKKKNGQIFRTESYLNVDDETLKKYSNDDIIMKSVEFGLMPLQIFSDSKYLNNIKNRKFTYDKTIKNQKLLNKFEILDTNKTNIYPIINEKYWDSDCKISFNIKNKNGSGKLQILKDGVLLNEIIDHDDEISHLFYNRRLNMFVTTSHDGYACIYILPNKLISIIKHPKNLYYNKVFLSANPFPSIIAYEKENKTFSSYTLSGILINKIELDKNKIYEIKIYLHFDVCGGCYKDRIEVELNDSKKVKRIFYDLPFFDEVK